MSVHDLLILRDSLPSDKPFIYATWIRAHHYGNKCLKKTFEPKLYSEYQSKIIDRILQRKEVSVSVACLKEDNDVVVGYAVYEGTTAHFAFVKEDWRRAGIATSLLPKDIEAFSHSTHASEPYLLKKFPNAKLNPYLI